MEVEFTYHKIRHIKCLEWLLTMVSDSVVPTITTVEFQYISFPSERNLTPIKAVNLILCMFLKMQLGGLPSWSSA